MHFDLSFLNAWLPFYKAHQEVLGPAVAFLQVVFIDIVMAGDNAVAVGIAAAGLEPDKRRKAIMYGLIGAIVTRIGFVLITVQLLKVVGLLLAGGLLLLWVCWKMWRELRHPEAQPHADGTRSVRKRSLASAVMQILIADVSMSLDNVLAVTGAAEDHVWVLAFGLLFSIAAMGVAANVIAKVLHRYHWIGYVGVLVVLGVACKMIWEGGTEVWEVGHCDATLKCLPELGTRFMNWISGLAQLVSKFSHA